MQLNRRPCRDRESYEPVRIQSQCMRKARTDFSSSLATDTLDLQDHDAPSAQAHPDHPRPAPLGAGPAAPHQEDAIRHMNEERSAEQEYMADAWGSGHSSHEGSELLEDDVRMTADDNQPDDTALHQNGGDDSQVGDGEGDDMMDDRMSSSPSINDDGVYGFSFPRHESSRIDSQQRKYMTVLHVGGTEGDNHIEEVGSMPPDRRSTHDAATAGGMDSAWDLFEPERDYAPLSIGIPTPQLHLGYVQGRHDPMVSVLDLSLRGRVVSGTSPSALSRRSPVTLRENSSEEDDGPSDSFYALTISLQHTDS